MTNVVLKWKDLDGVTPHRDAYGRVIITPHGKRVDGDTLITDKPITVEVNGQETVNLPANSPNSAYEFRWKLSLIHI